METVEVAAFVSDMVKVLFFAKSRELVDCSEASLQIPAQLSGRDLHSHIIACYPRLQPIQNNMLLALNHEYIELSDAATIFLRPADEIAVIPPLSGG